VLFFAVEPRTCLASAQYPPLMAPLVDSTRDASLFSYKSSWQVLGPFQIGTRGTLTIHTALFYVSEQACVIFD
jgi:hypothetical protein